MQIPGLLIEYLITGSVALIWLVPLLSMSGVSLQGCDGAVIALFAPGLYVVGMIVDSIGWFVLRPQRRRIRQRVYEGHDFGGGKVFDRDPRFLVHVPELAKANEMYSSRDRIARGAFVSVVVATIVHATRFGGLGMLSLCAACVVIGAAVSLVCWGMWARYQRASYEYEIQAFLAIEEKLRLEREAGAAVRN